MVNPAMFTVIPLATLAEVKVPTAVPPKVTLSGEITPTSAEEPVLKVEVVPPS